MVYLVFRNPEIPCENRELVAIYTDVIEAIDAACFLSEKHPEAYEVRKYLTGFVNGAHWSCDDLADDGTLSATYKQGIIIGE